MPILNIKGWQVINIFLLLHIILTTLDHKPLLPSVSIVLDLFLPQLVLLNLCWQLLISLTWYHWNSTPTISSSLSSCPSWSAMILSTMGMDHSPAPMQHAAGSRGVYVVNPAYLGWVRTDQSIQSWLIAAMTKDILVEVHELSISRFLACAWEEVPQSVQCSRVPLGTQITEHKEKVSIYWCLSSILGCNKNCSSEVYDVLPFSYEINTLVNPRLRSMSAQLIFPHTQAWISFVKLGASLSWAQSGL